MPAITSLGVGSGLDLNSLVDKLVAVERQPLNQLQRDANKLQTQVSAYGQIKSLFSTMQDAVDKLTDTSLWTQTNSTSSDSSAVSVVSGTNAAAGSYAVTVQQLAANQTVVSNNAFSSSGELVGSGRMTIELGKWNTDQSQFSGKSGATAVSIDVSSTDTLSTLRDKINASDAGVSAALITDASGVRLSLRSTSSGAENGFRITTTSSTDPTNGSDGLSRFGFDPPGGTTTLGLKHPASNALATVNGISVESSSNDVTGVVDGLTLRLQKQTDSAVNIDVSRNKDAVVTAVKTFADAYNQLAQYIASQTKYDAASKSAGTLQGDGSLTNLQARLRSLTTSSSAASGTYARLSDIGLQMQRDGTLKIDDAKLQAAAGNPAELKKALSASNYTNSANSGFARQLSSFAEDVLSTGGTLTARTDGLQKLIDRNSADQTKVNDRADLFQTRLIAQYTALDSQVAKLNSLSSYVTQQLAQFNKSSN